MGDRVVVYVDRLVKPNAEEIIKNPEMVGPSSSMTVEEEDDEVVNEEVPLICRGECRICQEEDSLDKLESPCACSGSLKYAHRACVQHWCDEKGDITCEICHQQYQPGYTVPPRTVAEETIIDIGGGWQISGTPLDLHDPRLLAIAEAERQLLEDDYNSANASGAAFCRSAALILMALLLLRHALPMTDTDGDDEDPTAFFSLFLLRAVGFLLPCYIMLWAISILQQRKQREEAEALAATQFAVVLHSGQSRGVQFTIASATPATPATPAVPASVDLV
ncbi:uncharacterized protein LOC107771381 [Nicotiana tabacum]|uniref:RING-CH-type domain-containing protein n=2 Tax=Nicotiana TaxID=4085 RepID=A0A1S3Y1X2_TOBAC|nr:PREDICTED: uncharacterized protein LOC104223638 [Nicotiana sylvestris]XP_009773416.1 PREDICTED: uncharacterized protein LOC104223638 [Nicotiana sylvestris]XP_009773417.1 PREDICTED: uncharacterized protein LOC104223638 [Nicotiana sylvestris]XP_016446221.1 PREDICTED: uncharacterized protein LOC107771381 [Nicotiana tabacum]XP_016446222.1 PREDICTED: uncharacterized protein LOC107771381 [Nicotiana tabacum]XP_016446223.1 PREDICTED: uncharacterized protein LOC107771381 [Nicotiana tabacum]